MLVNESEVIVGGAFGSSERLTENGVDEALTFCGEADAAGATVLEGGTLREGGG